MGTINGVPLNTERSKPKRHRNEVEESDDPIVANKATIAEVLFKLFSVQYHEGQLRRYFYITYL